MKKLTLIVIAFLVTGIALLFATNAIKKASPNSLSEITVSTPGKDTLYQVRGQVIKWFPETSTVQTKLYLGKTVYLKLGEYPQTTIIAPDPKNPINTTILERFVYTKEEWGRVFCDGDEIVIGTKENIWSKIKNSQQIEPDFVNVEHRTCF